MIITKKHLSRRTFLRGALGATRLLGSHRTTGANLEQAGCNRERQNDRRASHQHSCSAFPR